MSKRYRVLSSLAVLICLFVHGTAISAAHTCNSEISKAFDLTKGQMGYMYMGLYMGTLFSSVFSGAFADRKGKLAVTLFGACMTFLGSLSFAFSHNMFVGMVALGLIGIGGGTIEICVNSYIGDVWKGKRRNTMYNFIQTSYGTGTFLGSVLAGFILKLTAKYINVFFVIAIMAIVGILFLTYCVLQKIETPTAINKTFTPWIKLITDPILIGFMMCLFVYMGIEAGFSEWSSVYYQNILGMSESTSAYALSIFWVGLCAGSFVFGLLASKLSRKNTVLIGISGVILFCFIWHTNIVPICVFSGFWIGFFLGPIFGTIVGIATDRNKIHTGAISSIMFCGTAVGASVLPGMIGLNADLLDIDKAMVLLPIYSIILFVLFAYIVNKNKPS